MAHAQAHATAQGLLREGSSDPGLSGLIFPLAADLHAWHFELELQPAPWIHWKAVSAEQGQSSLRDQASSRGRGQNLQVGG